MPKIDYSEMFRGFQQETPQLASIETAEKFLIAHGITLAEIRKTIPGEIPTGEWAEDLVAKVLSTEGKIALPDFGIIPPAVIEVSGVYVAQYNGRNLSVYKKYRSDQPISFEPKPKYNIVLESGYSEKPLINSPIQKISFEDKAKTPIEKIERHPFRIKR